MLGIAPRTGLEERCEPFVQEVIGNIFAEPEDNAFQLLAKHEAGAEVGFGGSAHAAEVLLDGRHVVIALVAGCGAALVAEGDAGGDGEEGIAGAPGPADEEAAGDEAGVGELGVVFGLDFDVALTSEGASLEGGAGPQAARIPDEADAEVGAAAVV